MANIRKSDIICEILELCQEILAEISQQLSYYRASVYKHETATRIKDQIQQFSVLMSVIGDDQALDIIRDYEALSGENALALAINGECPFTARVAHFLQHMSRRVVELHTNWQSALPALQPEAFIDGFRKHQRQIVSICKQGSRHWTFFKSI